MGTGIVLKALRFAAHKHRDQRRKDADASPYINHPIALVETPYRVGDVKDPATLAAALLHDTIEDTETTPEELSMLWQLSRSALEAYSAVLELTFRRFYASSLRRPWLRGRASAYSDAIYRLSIEVAAPYLLVLAVVIGLLESLFPNLLPGRSAVYLFAAVFVSAGISTVFALSGRFKRYVETPEIVLGDEVPRTRGEWLFAVVSFSSILGYVLAALLLL